MGLSFSSLRDGFGRLAGDIGFRHVLLAVAAAAFLAAAAMAVRSASAKGRASMDAAYAEARRRAKAEKRNRFLLAVYQTAARIPGVKGYVGLIERSYLRICPYDDAYLMRLASETLAVAAMVSAAGVLAVLSFNLVLEKSLSLYSAACAVLAVYILGVEVLHYRIGSKEKKIAVELIHYFATVEHLYPVTNKIAQTVVDAADGMSYEINLHAMQIYGILTGSDTGTMVREYALSPETNKYLRSFISQVYEVSERGDSTDRETGASLFARNLEFLRMDIMKDRNMRQKQEYRLQGYTMVAALPVFFMVPLRIWGIDFDSATKAFYDGIGHMAIAAAIAATVMVYGSVSKAKGVSLSKGAAEYGFIDRKVTKGFLKKYMQAIEARHGPFLEGLRKMLLETNTDASVGAFVVRMTACALAVALMGVAMFSAVHIRNRQALLETMDNIESVVYVATERQRQAISGHILDMTKKFAGGGEVSQDELKADFMARMYLPNAEAVEAACNEVARRVAKYRDEYFKWYELVLCLLVGAAASFLPVAGLRYRYGLMLAGRGAEVRQFQAIIIMERNFGNVTVRQILEEMENFAVIFRRSIRTCLNSYSSGPREALLELKESEKGFYDFTELVDGFLAVETVGIAAAFSEIQNNREMAESRHQLEEEILLSKKVDYTDLLAAIPSYVVLGGYLLLPFAIEVVSSAFDVFELLDTLGGF